MVKYTNAKDHGDYATIQMKDDPSWVKFAGMFCIVVFFITCLFAIIGGGKGIVAVDNWPHGVALCEGQLQEGVYGAHLQEATVWNNGHATFVVNAGHEDDPELQNLQAAALIECSKY